jgi:CRISPR system Cascade subunit CasC
MDEELAKKEKLSGSLFGKIAGFDFGKDESFSIDTLIASVIKSTKA